MTATAAPAGLDLGTRVLRVPAPTAIVIFGASGDLTRRKLMPALFSLAEKQLLPPETAIVGFARQEYDDDSYRAQMREDLQELGGVQDLDDEVWESFASRLYYMEASFDEAGAFDRLRALLDELDAERGIPGNRVYYLATAPTFFPLIADNLGAAGLTEHDPDTGGRFSRLIVEKPFGTDLPTARSLNTSLSRVFVEDQIYRIDHYLGKETVQNLMVLRFGNAIFEPIWNRRYVDHVQITVAESLGVGTRGGYYDTSGALRDIVQNHVMQVLSLVAMEPPARFEAREVRDEKVKVLRAIREFDATSTANDSVRARYAEGWIDGEAVPAYADEQGVADDSTTETYTAMRVLIDSWRWAGTPFYLRTGKRMPKRATEVAIQFKGAPMLPFASSGVDVVESNLLVLRIQPDEGASLRFQAKTPGPQLELRSVSMDFSYGTTFLRESPDAYERLLLDCMLGDATLFARWDEVERAWEIYQGMLEAWENGDAPLVTYPAGSWGPDEADRLIEADGRSWHRL
ncbi:MAG: glucose-6-phosphate dehydrogenase [Miltoncostaeaceae bacterium]